MSPRRARAPIAHVILNRTLSGRWGDNIKEVVTHPWQFEPWMTRRREMQRLSPQRSSLSERSSHCRRRSCRRDARPTAGATHFLNPDARSAQRRGGSLPAWAHGEGHPIGRHTFYSPDEGKAAPRTDGEDAIAQAAALSLGIMAISTVSADSACSGERLTARSPRLPADDLVLLDVGFSPKD